jgi:glycerol-3-phosphate dehydrogenase
VLLCGFGKAEMKMTDVAIIGGGVTGCAIARELSRYQLDVRVFEKASDLAEGTSKANSGIVHAGYDARPGSLKAKFNILGAAMFPALSRELDVPYRQNGSLVVGFSEADRERLSALFEQGRENGVAQLQLIDGTRARELCPSLAEGVCCALYAPTAGIVCPYELTLAFAENAAKNGVRFSFNAELTGLEKHSDGWRLTFADGTTETARVVINAAGVYADVLNNMVSETKLRIIPRRGEYCLFDRAVGGIAPMTIFQVPTPMGKGVLVTQTVDGNLLVGPTAVDIPDKEDVDTTAEGLAYALATAARSVGPLPERQIITSFAGLRAHLESDDFVIGEAIGAPGFINVAGIESPGLTSAPAIGVDVAKLVSSLLGAPEKADFDPVRHGIPKFREMTNDERARRIAEDPAWGRVVCRCETVTEAEIVEAIRRPLGATTLDGIKRRTRAGMGRCQSGFCTTRVLDILSRELGVEPETLTKHGAGSEILTGTRN